MKEALVNLLKVKSIVTLCITAVFCYLAIIGQITGEQLMLIFSTIIGFYFGTQSEKSKQTKEPAPQVETIETVRYTEPQEEGAYLD